MCSWRLAGIGIMCLKVKKCPRNCQKLEKQYEKTPPLSSPEGPLVMTSKFWDSFKSGFLLKKIYSGYQIFLLFQVNSLVWLRLEANKFPYSVTQSLAPPVQSTSALLTLHCSINNPNASLSGILTFVFFFFLKAVIFPQVLFTHFLNNLLKVSDSIKFFPGHLILNLPCPSPLYFFIAHHFFKKFTTLFSYCISPSPS